MRYALLLGAAALLAGPAPTPALAGGLRLSMTHLMRPQVVGISAFSPAGGVAGTTVTISGTGFMGAAAVTFNGLAATSFVVAPSGTSLTAVVPVGATSGPIMVIAPGGVGTSATAFGVDLVVGDGSTVSSTSLPAGTYRHVTVRMNATAHLTGPTQVTGLFLVQLGGSLYTNCQVLGGPGQFTNEAGSTLYICNADGIRNPGAGGGIQVVNRRIFHAGASYVYNGFAPQQTGDGLPASVNVLVVDNAAGVDLTRDQTVVGLLIVGGGDLRLGAHDLTLASTSTRTAVVNNFGAGRVLNTGTGRARMQRAITLDPAFPYRGVGYRHYSSPMQASTVADLTVPGAVGGSGFVPVVNPSYNALPTLPMPIGSEPNVLAYDQSRLSAAFPTFNIGWLSPASLDEVLVPGRGYSVRIQPAAVVDFVGELTRGDVPTGALDLGFGAEAGWHLLGNPYPSNLDWQLVRATPGALPAGLDDQVSVFEPTRANSGFYRTYINGVGTGGFDGLLAPMQGFFVHVSAPVAAPGFVFRDAYRPNGMSGVAFHRAATDARPRLTLTLAAPDGATDETVVYLEAGATAQGVDAHFDAHKQPNPGAVPLLATRPTAGTELLAINGLPVPTGQLLRVPLVVEAPGAGTYQLTPGGLTQWPADLPVALLDRATGTVQALRAGQAVAVELAAGRADDRFELLLGQRVTGQAQERIAPDALQVWPNPARGSARVTLPAGATRLDVLDLTGRLVRTVAAPADGAVTLTDLPAGLYVLRAGATTRRLVVE